MNASRLRIVRAGMTLALMGTLPYGAAAGQFTVTPIKLVFDAGAKSGVVTVANEEERTLQLQMKAFRWTQDSDGRDGYTESDDLIFFPKVMRLDPHEQRVLRVGVKGPPPAREQTYRLFIQEIPGPRTEATGSQVQVAIRFGVPIFVEPSGTERRGRMDGLKLADGSVELAVRNTGNAHFIIQSVVVRGADPDGHETFSHELSGWYLLAGTGRTYRSELSPELCRETTRITVSVTTTGEPALLRDSLNVDRAQCRH